MGVSSLQLWAYVEGVRGRPCVASKKKGLAVWVARAPPRRRKWHCCSLGERARSHLPGRAQSAPRPGCVCRSLCSFRRLTLNMWPTSGRTFLLARSVACIFRRCDFFFDRGASVSRPSSTFVSRPSTLNCASWVSFSGWPRPFGRRERVMEKLSLV